MLQPVRPITATTGMRHHGDNTNPYYMMKYDVHSHKLQSSYAKYIDFQCSISPGANLIAYFMEISMERILALVEILAIIHRIAGGLATSKMTRNINILK